MLNEIINSAILALPTLITTALPFALFALRHALHTGSEVRA